MCLVEQPHWPKMLPRSSPTPALASPHEGTRPAGEGDRAANQAAPDQSLSFQDQQTLTQIRRGNWSAMEQLVTRYQDRLFVTLLRMVNQQDDAADLVQETFVRAMQGVSKFEGKSTLYTWLFRIAVNLAISHRQPRQICTGCHPAARWRFEADDSVNRQSS